MKKLFILLLIASCIFVSTACSTTSNETNSTDSEKSEELQKLTLMLDWYPNAVHSAIYMAQENGYFKEQGLDVEILMPSETNDPLRLTGSGQVDVAISYQSQLLISREQDIPVISIASYVQSPLNEVMVLADSGITSPKDFEGRKVGYASSEVTEKMLRSIIKNDGGNPDNVEFIDVGFDLIPALTTGNVDGLEGAYINHEKLMMEQEGYEIDIILHSDYGVPKMLELIFITGEDTLAEKKDALTGFITALTKAQADVVASPEAALALLLSNEKGESPLDEEVERQSLALLIPLMGNDESPFGTQDEAQYDTVIKWLQEESIISDKVSAADCFINLINHL